MTLTNEWLDKIRKEFFSSLNQPEVSSVHLRGLINEATRHAPQLLSEFQQNEDNILSKKAKAWNTTYFDHHIEHAKYNFSRERIEHLIEVRDFLRDKGVKGFVPSPPRFSNSNQGSTPSMASSHTPSDNLQKFVASGDLPTIRTALRLELNRNNLASDALRADLEWTKARVPGLFEAYSEKMLARGMVTDSKLWDSEYYANQVVYLKTNFSEERFLHLIEVRSLLRQQGVEGFAARNTQSHDSSSQTLSHAASSQPQQHNAEHKRVFRTALIIGGAVAALAILLITLINGQN
ncbi:hypothetical protein [Halomonas sp. QHL1]|uniref:hypothetical protein n=1 Tax=Halomonas sp. QHL1 TaxID=1123773 RepID=UPI000B24FA20|nr:hypothetical protein [Halomonas sp. QHL1]